jgi:hypothetical protein
VLHVVGQDELDSISKLWNIHYVRHTRNSCIPGGVPNIMAAHPHLYTTRDYKLTLPPGSMQLVQHSGLIKTRSLTPGGKHFYELCMSIMRRMNLAWPSDANSALRVYLVVRAQLRVYFP